MDLAICWDYRPLNPNDEPKKPKHIDGSNGSAAPAVFTLVKTPRSPIQQRIETVRSGGVFSNTHGESSFFDRDVVRQHQNFQKNHDACRCGKTAISYSNTKEDTHRCSKIKNLELLKRCESSPNISSLANPSHESNNEVIGKKCYHNDGYRCLSQKKNNKHQHQQRRSSEKCEHNKNQRICQISNQESSAKPQKTLNYKQAFKAGIPKSNSSGTCESFDSGCRSITSTNISIPKVNIPKPRNPYVKKDYTINTLVPPFACWKGILLTFYITYNFKF